ncbi:hypothetical protein B0H10DRAFT_1939157 [Mycena sp. CBHHK59/15]|nr:hypothetical protein B0H10DRAFT_1939157 [Mycena sp. CBHHK59/15]
MGKNKHGKRKDDTDEPRKKRGTPSDFQGSRLEFLQSRVPEYLKYSKKKQTREFWADFMHDYWCKFPWRVPLEEEPPPGADLPPSDAEAAFKALDMDLSPEEEENKSQIQTATKKKIKGWFNRQRPANMGIHLNPFFDYLARMRRQNNSPCPKCLPDHQFYLQHDDFKEEVARQFQKEYGHEPRSKHISLRCQLAQKLLKKESDDVKQRIKEENDAVHEAEVEEWEEEEEGLPSLNPAIQQQCRERFTATVAPLLNGLRAYTGYTINIVAAWIDGANVDVVTVNAGTVDGKDWARWDAEGYRQMLPRFLKFVHAEHVESQGSATSVPMPEVPPIASTSNTAPAASTSGAALGADLEKLIQMPPGDIPSAPADVSMGPPALPPLVDDVDDINIMSGALLAPRVESTSNPPPPPPPIARTPALAPSPPAATPAPVTDKERIENGLDHMCTLEGLVPEKEVFGVRRMSVALRAEVVAMGKEERALYVRRLQRMPSPELTRENNLARNRAWTGQLGLGSATAFVGMKRTGVEGGRKGKKKCSKKNEEEAWGSDDESESGSDSDSEEGDGDNVGRRSTPPATRARGGKNIQVPKTGTTKWAEVAKKMLLEGGMGGEWESMTKTYPTGLPPKEVGVWVKNARKGVPKISVETFPKEWWGWWTRINPGWRVSNGVLGRDGDGNWDDLRCPGQNGFLNVIMCLKWWHAALEGESEDWKRAVDDAQ